MSISVRLMAAAIAIFWIKANARDIDSFPIFEMLLFPILTIEIAPISDMIIRGKAASCPVSNSANFNRDLENALKINELDINQGFNNLLILDKWDRIAGEVFNCASYDQFIELKLNNATFFGQNLLNINDAMIEILCKVEEDLINSQGSEYKAPLANSTLRKRSGMHGWGMAIDFEVGINPYVLNENSEEALDKDLIDTYDNIARLMLGKNESDLRKLKSGRSAFGNGSIGDVYDILQEESDAMKRYFSLMKDDTAFREFIETDWSVRNSDRDLPDMEQIKAQMERDYIILGGKSGTGNVWRTEVKEDRPFAPNSMRGKGDPATGFLNLGKEFVEAMTARGFAWGAIDISGEPGDIQHFDLRLEGVGARVYNLLLKYQ